MPPRVSILIPIYAPGPVLQSCLSSVARQTYQNLEIIPIDDAGPEAVQPILAEFARDDPRWRLIIHDRNLGLAASLNDGLHRSSGEYILILQQDCEILSDRALEEAVPLIQSNRHWCITGEAVLPLAEMNTVQLAFAAIWNHLGDPSTKDLGPIAFSELKCDLFLREALVAVGAFEERFRISGEDQVISHRLREAGWTIVRSSALRFFLRPGRQTGLWSHLRKESLYGRTQGAVLLHTAFAYVWASRSAPQGRGRLVNRAHGVASALGIFIGAIFAIAFGISPWFIVFGALPASRMFLVGLRIARVSDLGPRRAKVATTAVVLTPLDDLVYTGSFFLGIPTYLVRRRS